MENEKLIKICEMVAADAKKDAEEFDGQPFSGKVVATYFGYHGAAIGALAKAIKEVFLKLDEIERSLSSFPFRENDKL